MLHHLRNIYASGMTGAREARDRFRDDNATLYLQYMQHGRVSGPINEFHLGAGEYLTMVHGFAKAVRKGKP